MKKIILSLLLFFYVLPSHATDPAVLNGYWYMNNLESQLIRYPYIWKLDIYHGLSSIDFSQMRLIKSKGMYFVFLYERKALAVDEGGYFGDLSQDEDLEFFKRPYSLVRFTVVDQNTDDERFVEEICIDKTLNKRRDLMALGDKALSEIIQKSTCHEKSKKWVHNKYSISYKRSACFFIKNIPWYFTMIAPEYLPCNREYDEK